MSAGTPARPCHAVAHDGSSITVVIEIAVNTPVLPADKAIDAVHPRQADISITETALKNGLKPYKYLTYALKRMKNLGAFPEKDEMNELLPWYSNIPENCRSKMRN